MTNLIEQLNCKYFIYGNMYINSYYVISITDNGYTADGIYWWYR